MLKSGVNKLRQKHTIDNGSMILYNSGYTEFKGWSMERQIKAIQTRYNGYWFRSRLEARWAVFFDALEMDYEYESEGFQLSDGTRYLPDFWVPIKNSDHGIDSGYWVEIKPTRPNHEETKKAYLLALESGHNTIILAGQPWPGKLESYKFHRLYDYMLSNPAASFAKHDEYDIDGFWFHLSYPCASAGCNYDFQKAAVAARSARF
jgi:hypothetical protein